jgi:hypothetical protein
MMEHLTQGEDIIVHLSPTHLLALSERKNVKVEILGQNQTLTSYQSTEIMNEKSNHLHYSAITQTLEDDMWIIDMGFIIHGGWICDMRLSMDCGFPLIQMLVVLHGTMNRISISQ